MSSSLSGNNATSFSMQQNRPKASAATSANPFDDDYQPPNLAQEQEQQKVALLDGEHEHIDDVLLRERHNETLEITKEMRQIRDISLDLANIVDDQQTNFDVIEEDAHAIHDSAERGVGHLVRAAELIKTGSQTESFWKVLFGVLATGGLVIAIVCLREVFSG